MIEMKTNDKNKFECKIILNETLENHHISKSNLEFVLKHILKCNYYLVKHYNNMKKDVLDTIHKELNYYLYYNEYFINDKLLVLWIARRLDSILKSCGYENELNQYLDEKSNDYSDKYNNQKYYRTIIKSDDDCFKEYLPLKKSYDYYNYEQKECGEKLRLYSQFDKELSDNLYHYELNSDEIDCIKNFYFINKFSECELRDMINEKIDFIKENKNKSYLNGGDINWLELIRMFENCIVCENYKFRFENVIDEADVYELLKENKFEYNVNDDFIIIEKKDCNKKYGIIEVKSFKGEDIFQLIDFSEWIRYMNSHCIRNLNEMYIDKQYFN